MKYYIQCYDELFDENFQCEISEETALKVKSNKIEISNTPFPNLDIKSRFRSVRHPGWGKD